ncbi:MAG: NAD(P)-dependent oxidoreductase [Lachnospira sp.]
MKKIYAYEVRQDEEKYLKSLASEHEIEIVCSPKHLTLEEIPQLETGSGITVLGMSHYGEAEMSALAQREIHYLSTRTIGYNHIDLDAAKRWGIHVCNARYAPNGVADYTVMMILLCLRNYKQALWRMQVNDFSLPGLLGKEMKDLTIGIIGTGRIGIQVMKNLSGFGCRILCYGRHRNPEAEVCGEYVSLEELYRQSDVISLHLALTPDTYHIINQESISHMKDGVVLINCARGGLMDIGALIDGIEKEKIGALGLDTVEEEEEIVHRDLKTDIFADRNIAYLRQFKNVVYTYHMAFYTDAAVKSMAECGIQGILDMEEGRLCNTQLC